MCIVRVYDAEIAPVTFCGFTEVHRGFKEKLMAMLESTSAWYCGPIVGYGSPETSRNDDAAKQRRRMMVKVQVLMPFAGGFFLHLNLCTFRKSIVNHTVSIYFRITPFCS